MYMTAKSTAMLLIDSHFSNTVSTCPDNTTRTLSAVSPHQVKQTQLQYFFKFSRSFHTNYRHIESLKMTLVRSHRHISSPKSSKPVLIIPHELVLADHLIRSSPVRGLHFSKTILTRPVRCQSYVEGTVKSSWCTALRCLHTDCDVWKTDVHDCDGVGVGGTGNSRRCTYKQLTRESRDKPSQNRSSDSEAVPDRTEPSQVAPRF